jgi:hypothetical protein
MSRTLAWAAAALISIFSLSQDAYASCGPRVTVSAPTLDRTAAIGVWQGRVANTMNDLYSDWNYARAKSVTKGGKGLVVTGIPCNTR